MVVTLDGFGKSPSAALRLNFVVAAHLQGRFMNRPYSLDYVRLACRGELPLALHGRPAGRPYKRSHRFGGFLRDHQTLGFKSRQNPLRPPFSKGEKCNLLSKAFRKALVPLETGSRRDFREGPFKKLNGFGFCNLIGEESCYVRDECISQRFED
jgi:hypothetical protein